MSNIAGKAYAMNVITPMWRQSSWFNRIILMASRALPQNLGRLLGLSIIHFARWVIIKKDQWPHPEKGHSEENLQYDYMLFLSNFNGTWDQYIDEFADGLPDGLDALWFSSVKYPESIPITPFKDYITHNQYDTDYYYNATPGSAQRDIKCALKAYVALQDLAKKHKTEDPDTFAKSYFEAMAKIQSCLAEPGYAPVASLDTELADKNRGAFMAQLWPTKS